MSYSYNQRKKNLKAYQKALHEATASTFYFEIDGQKKTFKQMENGSWKTVDFKG